MNNEKNLIERMKIVLGLVETVKLSQAKLEDGTIVEFEGDELMVGSTLYVISEDGSKTTAPVGEHILENGTKVTVDENGVVTEIFEKEEEVEIETPTEPVVEETNMAELTPEQQTAIVSELMVILEPRITALEEAILMMGENYKKENEELKSQVQKLSEQPAGVPVKTPIQFPDNSENALSRIAKNKRK